MNYLFNSKLKVDAHNSVYEIIQSFSSRDKMHSICLYKNGDFVFTQGFKNLSMVKDIRKSLIQKIKAGTL